MVISALYQCAIFLYILFLLVSDTSSYQKNN